MFEMINYTSKEEAEKNNMYPHVSLRCTRCKNIEYHELSDFVEITHEYCVINNTIQLTCSNCGEKHTNKYIPLENQVSGNLHLPTCPTCGSHNVEKISTGKKLVGFAAVGVFSSNFNKTMECKSCGYKF